METLPIPSAGAYSLLIAPSTSLDILFELAARLAVQGPLRVLDGGNVFNAYRLTRPIRRHTPDLAGALNRIQLARAFTCYQMVALTGEEPDSAAPTLVLDFLATFGDENIRLYERLRLLEMCITRLQQASQAAPLLVWARLSPALEPHARRFLDPLLAAAGKVWQFEAPPPVAIQPGFFGESVPALPARPTNPRLLPVTLEGIENDEKKLPASRPGGKTAPWNTLAKYARSKNKQKGQTE